MAPKIPARLRAVPNSIVLLGDSITFNGGRTGAAPTQYTATGFWSWGQFLLGHIFTMLANLGVTGETSTQIAARVMSVINYQPGWVHILAGTNDMNKAAISAAQTIANLDYMLGVCEGAGIRVLLGTLPPNSTGITAAEQTKMRQVNSWIRTQSRTRRNVVVIDYYAALTTSAGNAWTSGGAFLLTTNDGVHPGTRGAYLMGKALAAAVRSAGVAGIPDLISDDIDATNCLLYAQMSAGGTSAIPTGWIQGSGNLNGGTVTYSKTARTDLSADNPRTWQTVVLAPSAPGVATSITLTDVNFRAGAWAVGDTIVGCMAAKMSNLDQAPATYYQAGVSLGLRTTGSSTGAADDLTYAYNSTSYPNHTLEDRLGVFRTPPLVIPAGTTGLQLIITIAGGGTYNFDQGCVLNVSRYGLSA